jgi:ferredoxin-nitrite reductase
MNVITPPMSESEVFTAVQQRYLEGYFAGLNASGITFGGISPALESTPSGPSLDDLTKEERIKHDLNPFDAIEQLQIDARWNAAPEPDMAFRYKWNGLFWLNPVKDGYMCRLRIPGGTVKSYQLRELASISRELTSGYIQITTRNNFQIRVIEPKNCPDVLRRIQGCGLHSKGAGADNIRNITANPAMGIDPYELIDVGPLVNQLSNLIIGGQEFYDLPRKFNIAFDGGGLISSVEDTNDIGATAVEILSNDLGIDPGIYFRICLGGVTGHQTFASDWGVIVKPDELIALMAGILRVFIRDGDRTNRKKARLKYIIEARGLDGFRDDVEALMKTKLRLLPAESPLNKPRAFSQQGHSHVGAHAQKQSGLFYIGASVPVGQMTDKQLEKVAQLADTYGTGEIRLTVWQNFIIPNIPDSFVPLVCKQLEKMGFPTSQSNVRNGFVACTGNRYCKFSSADTKGHAIAMMDYLDKRVKLDRPINIHFTGCAHSCAQHFMGDIGLLATKVKNASGESEEGYHVCVGGGFGENRKVGTQVFTGIPFSQLGTTLEAMLKGFLSSRNPEETFHDFCHRHPLGELQAVFCEAS